MIFSKGTTYPEIQINHIKWAFTAFGPNLEILLSSKTGWFPLFGLFVIIDWWSLFWPSQNHMNLSGVCWRDLNEDWLWWQADGAIGEPSDESDFSLLAWDSFSQEIRDLFTVVRSITSDYLYSIVKTLWIYLKCSHFLPKKEELCYFYREERKTEQK